MIYPSHIKEQLISSFKRNELLPCLSCGETMKLSTLFLTGGNYNNQECKSCHIKIIKNAYDIEKNFLIGNTACIIVWQFFHLTNDRIELYIFDVNNGNPISKNQKIICLNHFIPFNVDINSLKKILLLL